MQAAMKRGRSSAEGSSQQQSGEEEEEESVSLGPIMPQHLAEARRRLISRGEMITPKPKPMFLRKTWF